MFLTRKPLPFFSLGGARISSIGRHQSPRLHGQPVSIAIWGFNFRLILSSGACHVLRLGQGLGKDKQQAGTSNRYITKQLDSRRAKAAHQIGNAQDVFLNQVQSWCNSHNLD